MSKSRESQDKRADYLQGLLFRMFKGESSFDWRVSFDSTGRAHIFEVVDEELKTLKRVFEEDLDSFIRIQTLRDGELMIRGQESQDIIKSFRRLVSQEQNRRIPMPRLIGDAESLNEWAMTRLEYSLRKEAELHWDTMGGDLCPFLKDVQESLEEPAMWDVLKCWVGKMLLENTSAPDVLIWFGKGGDGKTTFFQALRDVIGMNVSTVIGQDALSDKFGTQLIADNRLVVVEEADDSHKIWGPTLKMLTGNDVIKIEQKYKDAVYIENRIMVAMITNAEPALDKQSSAQLRRLRLIVSKPVVRTNIRTQQEIAEEFKSVSRAFFGACVSAYLEKGCVPVNSERIIDELSEDTLGPVMSFARQHFRYEDGAFTPNEVVRDIMTAHRASHSLKNVRTAIGNLDKRIDINFRKSAKRGVKNVVPTGDGFHGFVKPYDESKVITGAQARQNLKDSWNVIGPD